MTQPQKLKGIIFTLIGDNQTLFSQIKNSFEKEHEKQSKINLNIYTYKGSGCNYDRHNNIITIDLGCQDVLDTYSCIDRYMPKDNKRPKFSINKKYFEFGNKVVEFIAYNDDIPGESIKECLKETDFLSEDNYSVKDIITIYSLAYTLYHEFGHVFNDNSLCCQMQKEFVADEFAFSMLSEMSSNKDDDTILCQRLGFLLGIAQVLLNRKSDDEDKDIEHPHSIERIYNFLKSLNIKPEDKLYDISLKIIDDWLEKQDIIINWIDEDSITSYQRITDHCMHFKKPNNF